MLINALISWQLESQTIDHAYFYFIMLQYHNDRPHL